MTVVVGILAVTAMAVAPGLSSRVRDRGSVGDMQYVVGKLRALRLEAMREQGAARLTVAPSPNGRPGVYVISGHADAGAGSASDECLHGAFSRVVFEETRDLDSPYYLRVDAPNGLCFFANGSSTGGSVYLRASPAENGEVIARVDVAAATGLPDVVMANGR